MSRSVLILGASSDIGLSIVNCFLDNGWSVIAHGNSSVSRLSDLSGDVEYFQLDMSDILAVSEFIKNNTDINEVDTIINCLGFMEPKKYFDLDMEHLIKTFSVNFFSPLLFNSDVIQEMTNRNWGRIVNLGSIGVKFGGGEKTVAYSMTKHLLEFMPADHKKWAAHNVLYNTVRVGVTDTRIHYIDKTKNMEKRISLIPIGRMAETKEIAEFVFLLGSEKNTYITGQVLTIAGGE